MRKLILSFISIIMIICLVTSHVSASNDMFDISEAMRKTTFAAEARKTYMNVVTRGMGVPGTVEEVDAIIQQYSFAETTAEKERIIINMDTMGLFIYCDRNANAPHTVSNGNDVQINYPIIVYNAFEDSWIVSVSGYWLNSNFANDSFSGNIGDADAFGFGFTNIGNTYTSSVLRSSAKMWSQETLNGYSYTISTTSRHDGNGALGCGYRLQDRIEASSLLTTYYRGYRWYGSSTYDSNFANYSAIATAYYTHTYEQVAIESISFGVSGESAGVSVEFSTEMVGFTVYSGGDAVTPGYPS